MKLKNTLFLYNLIISLSFFYSACVTAQNQNSTFSLKPELSKNENCDARLQNTYFETCYSMTHKQSLWAFHELTETLIKGNQGRTNNFKADYRVQNPVLPSDYKGSGFDRGHLVPAADMKLNTESMSETFFMTNMIPQNPSLNSGVWSQLENQIRSDVLKYGSAYVVTAPLLVKNEVYPKLQSGVSIPSHIYKIVYFYEAQIMKAFLMPNEKPEKGLKTKDFLTTVDELETLTGFDFYSGLPDDLEASSESGLNNRDLSSY
jgi:endonuclease G, mitochondrial